MASENKKIMLSGGGSGGPVTPLLEITKTLRLLKPELEFVFVGTETGPEKKMVADFGNLRFVTLPAGKFRRYFSLKNFSDIFLIGSAFFKSFSLLKKERPSIVISVGSFASVPLIYAAALLKIPVLIHQQDIRPGLANRLMAPCASVITAVFEKTLVDYGPKAVLTGNPISLPDKEVVFDETLNHLFKSDKPLVLILGGGTGAIAINDLVKNTKNELLKFCNLIHVSGKNKADVNNVSADNYLAVEFLSHDKLMAIMAKSSLIISRCGLATLTEISALQKPSILIPIPSSHQEDNAEAFARAEAALVLHQKYLSPDVFISEIQRLVNNKELLHKYGRNVYNLMEKGASEKIANIILEIIK